MIPIDRETMTVIATIVCIAGVIDTGGVEFMNGSDSEASRLGALDRTRAR